MITGSNLDVDASAEQLFPTYTTPLRSGLTVKTAPTNTGLIYVSTNTNVTAGTDATTDGFPLGPGESVDLELDKASVLYGIASVDNQKIFFIGL
jgi:hypothetical protein